MIFLSRAIKFLIGNEFVLNFLVTRLGKVRPLKEAFRLASGQWLKLT